MPLPLAGLVGAASRDGIMAALGVVRAVSTDTCDDFVRTNRVEQAQAVASTNVVQIYFGDNTKLIQTDMYIST